MSSRKRSRAEVDGDEDASSRPTKQAMTAMTHKEKTALARRLMDAEKASISASRVKSEATAPAGAVAAKPAAAAKPKKLSAAERAELAQQSLALQKQTAVWKQSEPATKQLSPTPQNVDYQAAPKNPPPPRGRPSPSLSAAQDKKSPAGAVPRVVPAPPRASAAASSLPLPRVVQSPPIVREKMTHRRAGEQKIDNNSVHAEHFREEGADVFHVDTQGVPERMKKLMIPIFLLLSIVGALFLTLYVANNYFGNALESTVPAFLKNLIVGKSPPCFSSSTRVSNGEEFSTEWAKHCTPNEADRLPCPPHAVCQSGSIVKCDDPQHWVPYQPLSSSAATSCIMSDTAETLVSLVTTVLEPWSLPSTCTEKLDGVTPPASYKRAADVLVYPYEAVIQELRGKLSNLGVETLEPAQFAELVQGRLSTLWDNDDNGMSILWIGLLPSHTKHLPASCRVAHSIVSLFGFTMELATSAIKEGVFPLLYRAVSFVTDILLILFWSNPLAFLLTTMFFLTACWWLYLYLKNGRDKYEFDTDVELAQHTALDILKRESEPLRCLALRDDIREQLKGNLKGKRFNTRVWPEVQSRLENDQRIQLRLVRNENSLLWVGPKAI